MGAVSKVVGYALTPMFVERFFDERAKGSWKNFSLYVFIGSSNFDLSLGFLTIFKNAFIWYHKIFEKSINTEKY